MKIINARTIQELVRFPELVDVIETAFSTFDSGSFTMPDRAHVSVGENTLLLMPCFTDAAFATKLVSVFPGNARLGLPIIQGVVILNDASSGAPVALMDGVTLTAFRTACVSGAGIRYLAEKDVDSLGLVGAGMQGFYQVQAACSQRNFKTITVLDRPNKDLGPFFEKLSALVPGVTLKRAASSEELMESSQVIITSTTSTTPVLPDDPERFKDRCIVGIGSFKPDMREFPEALFQSVDQCFVDTPFAMKESGDIAVPLRNGWLREEQVISFGSLVSGGTSLSPNGTRVFKSVGMALFDLFASIYIRDRAHAENAGVDVDF